MRCCLRPCTSARANILGILSIKQSSIPPTAQDAMRHGGASLRSRRRPHGATRRATLLPTRAALHSATRRATVSATSRYLGHRSAVARRLQHHSISDAAGAGPGGGGAISFRFLLNFFRESFQIWPGAAPAAGGPFFNRFLIEILTKTGPGRLRRPGGHFSINF